MEILRVNKDRINDMANLLVNTFNSEPWNESWTYEMAQERISGLLSNPRAIAYAAVQDDELISCVIGCITNYMSSREFYIEEFLVATAFQNKGYGTKSLVFIENDLKSEGVTSLTLLTEHGFPSEKFYEKNGFIQNKHLVFMKKRI